MNLETYNEQLREEELERELENRLNTKEEELSYEVKLSVSALVKMLERMALFNNYRITKLELKPLTEEEIEFREEKEEKEN